MSENRRFTDDWRFCGTRIPEHMRRKSDRKPTQDKIKHKKAMEIYEEKMRKMADESVR